MLVFNALYLYGKQLICLHSRGSSLSGMDFIAGVVTFTMTSDKHGKKSQFSFLFDFLCNECIFFSYLGIVFCF